MKSIFLVIKLLLFGVFSGYVLCDENFDNSTIFTVFPESGDNSTWALGTNLTELGCDVDGKVGFVVHGWKEDIEAFWVQDLLDALITNRGGCIIFMDYSAWSKNPDYFQLVPKFEQISDVLWKRLRQIENEGFSANNIFMFGFSFGARLVVDAATNFGIYRIKEIDVCDPAGPGFDGTPRIRETKKAAQNVQCIHTSTDKGTWIRDCHQNWLVGVCGSYQLAPFYRQSHGLCPVYYTLAFTEDYYAMNNIYGCITGRPITTFDRNFKLGYMEYQKSEVIGDLFLPMSDKYPYVWNATRR